MHRIDHPTAAPGNLFTEGNPATSTPATVATDDWLNDVQGNICDVVEQTGIALVKGDYTQLRQAIQAMLIASQKAVVINNATFEASVASGEVVRWDSANSRFDEAVADGTSNNRAVGVADVTNSRVYLYGECALFSGLTPGARYYLDASTPGAITTTAPTDAVMVGIAKSATVLWVDIDVTPAAQGEEAGSVIYVAKNTAPTGYLKANGALVSRTTYAALFAAIGTTFGVGDGSTTFGLPDLRGEFIRGWDDGRGVDSGRVFGASQLDDLKSHSHSIQTFGGSSGTYASGSLGLNSSTGATGGSETRPRNIALLACIKY
jgi:microcystin-dependent protein